MAEERPLRVHHIIGLDLGQGPAFSAVCVVKRSQRKPAPQPHPQNVIGNGHPLPPPPKATYLVNHLHRYPHQTRYTEVVEDVVRLKAGPPLKGKAAVVIDRTGVGKGVYDIFVAAGLRPVGVHFHGGQTETWDTEGCRVPKANLVSAVEILLETRRLKVVPALPHAALLVDELQGFRRRQTATGHVTYGASTDDWRTEPNDDLVFAVAMALWFGEYGWRPPLRPVRITFRRN